MLDHCTYDKIKLLDELSSVLWFIEKHAKQNALNAKDQECFDMLEKLAEDIEKHIEPLKHSLCK